MRDCRDRKPAQAKRLKGKEKKNIPAEQLKAEVNHNVQSEGAVMRSWVYSRRWVFGTQENLCLS